MAVKPGTRLGPYEVTALLGTGGMSEVYRARDGKLNRDVAIKILSDSFARSPDWLSRLEREAQLLASLNHPHIAQIYSLEEFPAVGAGPVHLRALVIELVEGPTLAERIARGPIPQEEAIPIAIQIAEALETAHERGIIHRDLKPANIKFTPRGAVKVLDFGLAKSSTPIGDAQSSTALMNSPTLASPATQSGMILGTGPYMAPEQARGQEIDKRTDLWAFGVVLYEMLTGRRPFDGSTISDTIAAVLRQDIDWTRLPPETSPEIRRVLRHCLERNPKNRFHDAADVRIALSDVAEIELVDAPVRPRGSRAWPWLAATVAGIALAAIVALQGMRTSSTNPAASGPVMRFAIEPPREVGTVSYVAAAPNGRFVVYEAQVDGEFRLFMRRLDELESRQVAGTEGARGPFISPDGEWIGFVRNATIYKVPVAGGDPVAVTPVQGGPGAAWMEDGRIVFARAWLSGLSIVSANGGTPSVVTTPDPAKQEIGHWWPSIMPGGRVLFTIATAGTGMNDHRIALLDPRDGSYRVLFPGAKALWLSSGHIVFYHLGRQHAVPFDLSSLTVGEPFPVLDDALEIDPAGDWSQTVAVTSTGALAYLPGTYVPPSRLTWIDGKGALTPLAFAPRPFIGVKLSPDGRRAATASLESGRLMIRVMDLERGTEDAPRIDGMNWNPVWLPDGRLSFTSMRKGDFDIYVKAIGGSGAEEVVLADANDTDPIAWMRNGLLVFQGSEPDGAYPLKLFDPKQRTITRLTEQHVDNGGSLSPDERWLAYQSAATGRSVVYVRSMTKAGPSFALTRDPGEFPVFMRDGKTLALVRGNQLVVRSWHEESGQFQIGPERVVAPLAFGSGWSYSAPYDVAQDGRFLAIVRTAETPSPRIRVVLNWDREVSRLANRDRR